MGQWPSYMALFETGALDERIRAAKALLTECRICPRECRVDRLSGETGICQTAGLAMVSSFGPHFGEESPLVGMGGSGTIFFTHCNLLCFFCQNSDISHEGHGREAGPQALAGMMLQLASSGVHNINFVTPTHVVPMILEALPLAIADGLRLPLVYNSGGYDSVESLKLLDGIFDIYMPDFKFWSGPAAQKYCGAADYPIRAREAVREMHRQVGDLEIDENGLARRGLLVRHLVMPEKIAGSEDIFKFLVEEVSPSTYINVMGQYRPCYRAEEFPELSRSLTRQELETAMNDAERAGLSRLDQRRSSWLQRL